MDQPNQPQDQNQQPVQPAAPQPVAEQPQPAPAAQEPAASGDVITYKRDGLKYTIKIDRKACIGATTCTAVAPKTFEMDDQNIAIVKEGTAAELDDLDTILAAAQACPVFAIIIEDETGHQIYPEKQ